LDIQTGGGEVLSEAPTFPPTAVATESWQPNVVRATRLLHPRGVVVVADPDEPPLPFADEAFDLVTSRHPTTIWWEEIARVLRHSGTCFAQHVGPASVFELIEFFLGPQPDARRGRHRDGEAATARAVGLEIVDLHTARLRKVIWWVPGFTVEKYRERLRDLHDLMETRGRSSPTPSATSSKPGDPRDSCRQETHRCPSIAGAVIGLRSPMSAV